MVKFATLLFLVSATAANAMQPDQCSIDTAYALKRVNEIRAAGQQCGNKLLPSAPPVQWNDKLFNAAEALSKDMAQRNYFNRISANKQTIADRVTVVQYRWKPIGDNTEDTTHDTELSVKGWVENAQHCENLMDPKFSEIGIACAARGNTHYGTYWTMVLTRP